MKRFMEVLKNNALSMSVAAFNMPVAYAKPASSEAQVDIDQPMNTVVTQIANVVLTIFRYVGIVLLIWGIAQVVMGFRNEDSDSKIRGIMTVVVAIVLILLKTIVKAILKAVEDADTDSSAAALDL